MNLNNPTALIGRLGTSTNWSHPNPHELRLWPACGEGLVTPTRLSQTPPRPSCHLGDADSSRSAYVAHNRAQGEVRRQVCAIKWPIALTLTFATAVTSRTSAEHVWRGLVRRFRRSGLGYPFGWICVLETHNDDRRLHLHAVVEREPGLWLVERWKHQYGDAHQDRLATLDDRRNFAAYMTKDMLGAPREPGERRYLAARGLKQRPHVISLASFSACLEIVNSLGGATDMVRLDGLNPAGTSVFVRWPSPLSERQLPPVEALTLISEK